MDVVQLLLLFYFPIEEKKKNSEIILFYNFFESNRIIFFVSTLQTLSASKSDTEGRLCWPEQMRDSEFST